MKQNFNKTNLIQIAVLLLLTFAIFMPITLAEIAFHDITDYPTYLDIAKDISVNPKYWSEVASNPLWTAMVLAVRNLLSIQHWKAALIVQMLNQGLLALFLYYLAKEIFPTDNPVLRVVLPLAIMIATPIFLITFKDQQFYNGYLGINSYHNPTIFALKPYVLILFFITAQALKKARIPTYQAITCALVVVLSSLIKPSFTICLLPAVGLYFMVRLFMRKAVDWKAILFCLFLPAILVLAYGYLVTYTDGEVSVAFYPFVVMKNSSGFLLPKFFLSIWFPLVVLFAYWKKAIENLPLILAWLTFFFGASYTYLLAEGGWRIFHGNYTWSGEISLFVLFAVSALFFFSQKEDLPLKKKWISALVVGFSPHLVCGVIYYAYCLVNNSYA